MRCKVFNIRLAKENRATDENYLNQFLETAHVLNIFASTEKQLVDEHEITFWSVLVFFDDSKSSSPNKSEQQSEEEEIVLNPDEERVFDILKNWRTEISNEDGIPPYVVMHNQTLKLIVKTRPKNLDELLGIKGFGKRKARQYGDEILAMLQKLGY